MKDRIITVFGSSLPKPGERQYEDALKLGRLLGDAGFSVCNGGNYGIMEAVSKGVAEAGQNAIGITVDHFVVKANPYLTSQIHCETMFERIDKLVNMASGYVVLQGGTGTLLELAVIWEFMNKKIMPVKPAVCHSSMWDQITKVMEVQIAAENRKPGLIVPYSTIEECADYIISRCK